MSNARAWLRLGFGAGLLSLIACAQGVQSDVGLTQGSDAGAASGGTSGAGNAPSTFAGASSTAGTNSGGRGGTPSIGSAGANTAGSVNSGGSNAGGSAGASSGGAGASSAGAGGAVGGSAGTSSGVAGGTGTLGCTHLQPGGVNGLQVKYKADDTGTSVAYVYFDSEIDNLDDTTVTLSDLKLRYYFNNDLSNPATEFYAPQIKHENGVTEPLSGSPTAAYTATYLEISFSSSQMLQKNESLAFQVHMHSDPNPGMHSQVSDYSFDPSGSLAPSCKVVLYQQTALAWGTPPSP